MTRWVAALVWLIASALPGTAAACSVCFGGEAESRAAFIWTTVGLSVLPLALIGAVVWWVSRRMRDQAGAEPNASSGAPPADGSRIGL